MPSSRTAPSSRSPAPSPARALLVAGAGLLVLVAYLALPTSRAAREFPLRILENLPEEWKVYRNFPAEKRFELYSRMNYKIPEMLRRYPPDTVILLPPRDYAMRFLPPDQTHWTDPRWIYYINYGVKDAPRRSVIWGREGMETATVAVILKEADAEQVTVVVVDLDEPGAWIQVEASYRSGGEVQP